MNKAVMLSIQPYWVFLIIAHLMGWNIHQEKTIEVRKDYPKASDWNKRVHIYCSKNRKSFNRIPKEYQPLMEKFLGSVIGEFVCDSISILPAIFIAKNVYGASENAQRFASESCLTQQELIAYCGTNDFLYGWHISNLKIYDTPKELGEFYVKCGDRKIKCDDCKYKKQDSWFDPPYCEVDGYISLASPFQSWGYVDAL